MIQLLPYLIGVAQKTDGAEIWRALFAGMYARKWAVDEIKLLRELIQVAEKTKDAEVWRALFSELLAKAEDRR